MSSEYLGWTERKPLASSRSVSSFDRDMIPGGPQTKSYESYVKNIFHPMNRLRTKDKDQLIRDHGLSASSILKMENQLGRAVIDDSYDDSHYFDKTPLESLYQELGIRNTEPTSYRNFPVYEPKQSSEYFATSYEAERERRRKTKTEEGTKLDDTDLGDGWVPPSSRVTSSYNDNYRPSSHSTYRSRADDEYSKNNTKTLIDYKEFNSSPLSPYLYQFHPYVRSQDSRIVGSNFVQLTSRPKDAFLQKIDATLAMVRDMPRQQVRQWRTSRRLLAGVVKTPPISQAVDDCLPSLRLPLANIFSQLSN
ncbi:unnamed protein product [Caenorhabditis auriculariae]|uniref:Uncharacterized protein n=1 Tax=Caenorhabditis auriculariae TaxID=2777116 RepID=A0A8S1GY08_9PELO|nr:unnamed protein product [Caenorhabditis auriculariae]